MGAGDACWSTAAHRGIISTTTRCSEDAVNHSKEEHPGIQGRVKKRSKTRFRDHFPVQNGRDSGLPLHGSSIGSFQRSI